MVMTKTKPDGSWNVVGSDGLHAYEKTGLSPESVELIRDENKRLVSENTRLKKLVDELQNILDGGVDRL